MKSLMRFSRAVLALLAFCAFAAGPAAAQDAPDDSPEALFQSGMSSFMRNDFEHSVEFLDQLVKVFGREPELRTQIDLAMYARACAYYNIPKYEEAIKAFGEYLAQYPESKFADEAQFRIGSSHQALEDYTQAIAAFLAVRSKYPRSAYAEDALYQVGLCYLLEENNPRAAETFKEFMAQYPKSPLAGQAGAFAARALFDSDLVKESVEMLEAVEKLHRSWSVISYCNFLAFEIGDSAYDETEYDLALKAYRRVKPKSAILRHLEAYVAQLDAAFAALRDRPVSPTSFNAHYKELNRVKTELTQAREMLNKLSALPDYDANLYHRIGRCFFNTDRFWEARTAFQRVVATATDPAVKEAAHFDLILCISHLRRYQDLLVEADSYLATYDSEGKWE